MNDLENFLDFLYSGLEGFVGVGVLSSGIMKESFFEWPNQSDDLSQFIVSKRDTGDVFITPSILSNRSTNKLAFKASQVLWADFDGTNPTFPADFPESHLVVQSSSKTKVHMYWRVPVITTSSELETLNKRIAYGCNADIGCWDCTRFLRPPGTINHKYENKPETRLVHYSPDRLGGFDLPVPALPSYEKSISLGDIPNSGILYNGLSPKLKQLFDYKGSEDRSAFLMRAGYSLAEEGYTVEQIVSLVSALDSTVGKFHNRADKLQRYVELALVAVAKVTPKEKHTPSGIFEILGMEEKIEWLVGGWLHKNGLMLMSGSPGVGKTQLAIQLSYSLSSGEAFLNKKISKPLKVMLLSLEMRKLELQYIFGHQVKGYTQEQAEAWDQNLLVFDPIQEDLSVYWDLISLYEPDVVIIDSVSELATDDLKESEARKITRWWDKVRYDLNVAIVVVHHDRKPTDGNKQPKSLGDVYGSYFFTKTPETVLTLWESKTGLELITLKARMAKKETTKLIRDQHLLFNVLTPTGEEPNVLDGAFNFASGQQSAVEENGTIHIQF